MRPFRYSGEIYFYFYHGKQKIYLDSDHSHKIETRQDYRHFIGEPSKVKIDDKETVELSAEKIKAEPRTKRPFTGIIAGALIGIIIAPQAPAIAFFFIVFTYWYSSNNVKMDRERANKFNNS